ncbi:MAG TPA: dTDP-Rha--alpha-D-GlcNAc-pyrophosphate polyprenol alpha-3-L-rhamnosyltransferase [Cytophagales bacterium]|nr:dTDP-Rha--alpha-D-GlcNAc-pyrophosphate polyprenol alpha-3-L-rhamnosyltransferase [Cytophagales bacterium]
MTKVAVVILNYNGKNYLEQFLPGVLAFSGDAKVIVADNCSTDGSAIFLRENFPSVELIQLNENKGFCEGYNAVLKQIVANYYVLLNSDVAVTEEWLTPIIELLDSDPSIAACQPKILSYQAKNKFEYAGAGGGQIDFLGYPFCRGRIFNTTEADRDQYNDTLPVFWASGACMVVRSDRYHEMGGLDEDFFAHMEEIDLCWKFWRSGNKVYYQGKSAVYHVGAGTLPVTNPKKTYLNFRNGLSLLIKHQRIAALVWKLPLRILLDWSACLHFILTGGVIHAKAVVIAHLSLLKRLSHELVKRAATKKQIKNFKVENIHHRLIVFEYFLRGKKTFGEIKNPK